MREVHFVTHGEHADMVNGLYYAASSMASQNESIEAIAGNLANLSTPGYKRDVPTFSSYLLAVLDTPPGQPLPENAGTIVQPSARIDLSDGPLRKTGNSFDLALQGTGFFVVRTPDGEAYTRNGTFALNSNNNLITQNGLLVLGERGPIQISGTDWAVTPRGEVMVDGSVVDRLRLVKIPAEDLQRIGNSLLLSKNPPTALDWSTTEVKQGFLEQSNADSVWEMVCMITAVRAFEANQRLIQAQDETLGQAVNQVARV